MFFKEKRVLVFRGILFVLVLTGILTIRSAVTDSFIRERQKEAQTVLNLCYENLSATFDSVNYAEQIFSVLDVRGETDIKAFSNMAQTMLETHEELECLAYFEGDTLTAILPEEEFRAEKGKNLRDFSYSYTLAKVIKEAVIEGPEQLSSKKNVFLFIYPIMKGLKYQGEIVAAVDSNYIIDQMGLDLLTDGGYHYELWRVNALGEHKTVIATSSSVTDYSNALKLTYNLPSVWTLSIIPEGGWFPLRARVLTDICFAMFTLLITLLAIFIYRAKKLKRTLDKTKYIEPDSGLYNIEGFCLFVNERIRKTPMANLCLLYIHLSNFHKLSMAVSREEVLEYLGASARSIQESFPATTIAGRLNEEVIMLALFQEKDDEKLNETIEDFILNLFWKKKIEGKKEFVNPGYCVVSYPGEGSDAAALIKCAAERCNH